MKFSIAKYLDYRRDHDELGDNALGILSMFDTMLECEGWDIEEVAKKKGVCLKEWCDDEITR